MASIFPNSPELNSVFTSNGTTWQWNGEAWTVVASDGQTFTNIVTSPSSQTISADSPTDTLTITAGTNISVLANSSNDSITINSTGDYSSVNSISTPDYIQFDTTANVNPVTGLLGWDSVEGTLNLGLSSGKHIHLGEESVFRVRNSTGSTIGKGTALYASGVEPSGRIQVTPYVADGSVREVRFMGLATESISSGVNGFVQHFGYVRDLDTRGTSSTSISVGDETWAAGDLLYVHPTVPGKLTNVKPQHEIVVAIIIIRHQSTGILFVRPTSGGHLEDIHDISLSSLSNQDILIYNSASSIWVNSVLPVSLPDQTGNSGLYLTTNGASASWANVDSLPDQTGNNGKFLTTNGASASWDDLSSSLSRWSKIYSASATVISGVDDNANNLDYTLGYATLFINGILQDPTNYTASSGSTIVLNDAVLINDVVEVLSYKTFNVANTYTTSEIDSKVSNYTRWVKTLSGSATVISGVDDNSLPLLYTIGNEEVYVNGILLKEVTDYATTSASSITLSEVALSGDTVEIINFTTINLASVYTKTESDNRYEPNIAYVSSSPSAPSAGTLWIDSTNSAAPALKVYNGSTWIAVSGAVSESGFHPFFGAYK